MERTIRTRAAVADIVLAPDARKPVGVASVGVAFIPGYASTRKGVKADFLEEKCRDSGVPFVRIDLRGHGDAPGSLQDFTVTGALEDVYDVMMHEAVREVMDRIVIVGSSLGGWISVRMAKEMPHRVQGLCLINPAIDITEVLWNDADVQAREAAKKTGEIVIASPYAPDRVGYRAPLTLVEDGRKHLLFENIVSAIKGDEPAQPTPLLGGMANDMLVRVIVGKEDTVVSPIIGTLLRDALASRGVDAGLVTIEGGDHRLSEPSDLAAMWSAVQEILDARHVIS